MKTFALLAALAVAAVSAQNTTSTPCDTTKLVPLLSDADLKTCSADSGLTIPPPADISADILTKACASAGCRGLLAKVTALNLGDCSIATFKIETDLINPLKKACPAAATVGGGSTAGSSAGAAVTMEPVTAGDAASSGSSAATTPAATTAPATVPTPAPSSGASAVAVATSAALVAVAAALL